LGAIPKGAVLKVHSKVFVFERKKNFSVHSAIFYRSQKVFEWTLKTLGDIIIEKLDIERKK